MRQAAIQATRLKVKPVALRDGTLVGLRDDGQIINLTHPETGEALKGPKDVDARTKLMVNALIELQESNSNRLRQWALPPEEVQSLQAQNQAINEQIQVLLKFKEPPTPRPKFVMPEFGTPGGAQAAPPAAPAPPQAPRRPGGLMEQETLESQYPQMFQPGMIQIEPRPQPRQ